MDIAIVGLGCRFPQAPHPLAFWDLIRAGRVTFRKVPASRWNHDAFFDPSTRVPDKAYIEVGAYLDDDELRAFDALHFGIAPRRLQVTDPQHRLLLDAVRGALQDAGYEARDLPRERTGVFVGASVSEHKELLLSRVRALQLMDGAFGRALEADGLAAKLTEDVPAMRAFSMAGNLLNMSAAIVAQTYDFGGPALSIDAACSSALVATQQAIVNLRAGQIDLALAGGVYLNLLPDNLVGFSRIGAISRSGQCRPFDAQADGFVMGEGVGAVLLKRREDAERDGDRIYAIIRGAAANNDGRSEGPMTPRQGGQLEALRRAWNDAGVSPLTAGYLEAHGTATTVGDVVEVGALRQLFAEAGWSQGAPRAALGSVKANIGHTMSAAGIAGLIKATLALHTKTLPPQPSVSEENARLELQTGPFWLPRAETPWQSEGPRRAAVSSFGFGGTNAHVVLEEAPEKPRRVFAMPRAQARPRAELFVLSGARASVVARGARELAASLPAGPLEDIALTLSRRAPGPARLAVVADSREQLLARLHEAASALEKRGDHAADPLAPPQPAWPAQLAPGIVFAQGPHEAKLALLFPGQGAQKVGLLREAYEQLPAFREALDALDCGEELLGEKLTRFLYTDATPASEARLTATQVCQPAMAAVGLALHALLEKLGVRADFALGHSLGEFAAAAAAGMLDPAECVRLVGRRGLAMVALQLPDPGGMVSAAAGPEVVRAALAEGAVAANLNHPKQTVVSGLSAAVAATAARLEAQGVQTTKLEVSHAFHSPLMGGVAEAMQPLVAALELREPRATVVSAISGAAYGDARDIWVRHATAPVDFVSALRETARLGARLWLQVGAGGVLTSFVRATLPESERLVNVALASREDDGLAQLSLALGTLWAAGLPLSFEALYEGRDARPLTLPPSALDVQPYWAIERPAQDPGPLELPAGDSQMPSQNESLVALFREQVALLQQQARVLEEQAQALAGRGVAVPQLTAPVAAPVVAPAPVAALPPPPPAKPAAAAPDVGRTVLASVARISAFPVEAIQASQTLVGDLGFDSLMTVELDNDIGKAFPGVGSLPRSLLGAQTTVQQIIDHVAQALSHPQARPAPTVSAAIDAVASEAPELLRFQPQLVEVANGSAAPVESPLPRALVAVGNGPVAQLLAETRASGPEGVLFESGDVRAALAAARAHAGAFLAVTPAPDAALTGFVRSLARARPDALVRHVVSADPAAAVAELRSGNAAVYVVLQDGKRLEEAFVPAPAGAPLEVRAGDVALVTGGTRGIGLKLAKAFAARGARVVVTGRAQPAEPVGTFVRWDVTQAPPAELAQHGPFTVLVHAAGVTEDASVANTDGASFERVFAPKVRGFENALRAAGSARIIVATASWAGRFGNAGQASYAAANAALSEAVARAGGISLELPPWDGTAMVAKLPALARRALEDEGVPFVDDQTGVNAVFEALAAGARGPVLLARRKPEHVLAHRTRISLSRRNDLYLDDHQLAGTPVLPLAAALDAAAFAALEAAGALDAPFLVRDFHLRAPVRVAEAADLSLHVDGGAELKVLLHEGGRVAYAAFVTPRADVSPARSSATPAAPAAGAPQLPLALDEFYSSYTFHGPRMRGIARIEQLTPQGIVGWVRTSAPRDLVAEPRRAKWTVDPLALDGAFQLAAYWAWTHLERAGFPVGIEEYVQLAPLPHGEVRASLTLEQSQGDALRGTIVLQDEAGRLLAIARGVEGEFKYRDPRFLIGRAAPKPAPAAAAPARSPAAYAAQAPAAPVPAVPEASYNVALFPEVEELEQRLGLAAAFGLKNPYFNVHERVTNDTSVIGGRTMINWSSYNYLGLSGDPEVTRAAQDAVERYGTSVSASRIASGEKPLHRDLEQELAAFMNTEDSIVTVSGHGVFVTVIPTLMKDGDLILHDALAHDCILAGSKLSGAKRRPFPHNDWRALEKQLQQLRPHYRRVLIAVEGVYSMDGDFPDLPRFIELKKKYGCLLLVDEAHSIGVLGETGAGIGEHFGVNRSDVDLWMGTLSKSFASCGGYVCGSKTLVQFLKYSAGGFVYSVGISPANAAAALAALRQLRAHPEKVARLHERASLFLKLAREKGIDTGYSNGSAVVPAILGNSMHALQVSDALKQRGINVQPILYPAVEETAARLRFFCTATHTEQQIRETVEVLAEEIARVRAESEAASA